MSDFKLSDLENSKSFFGAVAKRQKTNTPPPKTTGSSGTNQKRGLAGYNVSDILTGATVYRTQGFTYDVYNQQVSDTLQGFASNAKLRPYDVAVQDALTVDKFTGAVGTTPSGTAPGGATPIPGGGAGPTGGGNFIYDGQTTAAAGPGSLIYQPPSGKSWPKGPLTYEQVADLVISVGVPPDRAAVWVAIAQRESRHISTAHNPNASTGDNSYGLWQINTIDGAGSAEFLAWLRSLDLTDPWTNARAMAFLSASDRVWAPEWIGRNPGTNPVSSWYTNLDGSAAQPGYSVEEYMAQARQAVQSVLGR